MISQLQGTVAEKTVTAIVLEVHGVGYEVQIPLNLIDVVGEIGSPLKLYTQLIVREDAHQLFGFADPQGRALFRSLIKVNGVGPRSAIAILSSLDVSTFVRAIQGQNTALLVKIPGVGQKTAERLMIEMRDRLKEWHLPITDTHADLNDCNQSANARQHALDEAESALLALGYKSAQVAKMLSQIKQEASTTEDLIRLALRRFATL